MDRTTIAADGRDLAYVTAVIQDAAGVMVPTANHSMTFAVSGPGKIAGADNGDPIDFTAYSSSTRKAFNGKAWSSSSRPATAGQIVVDCDLCRPDLGLGYHERHVNPMPLLRDPKRVAGHGRTRVRDAKRLT